MKLIKPYSDDYMFYNRDLHQYVLTKKAVLELDGIDLSRIFEANRDDTPDTQVDRFLMFISRHFYNYVYSHANSHNRNVVEYALAKSASWRDKIKQCLLNEVEYALSEGAFWNKSGVNISKGSVMDLTTLRDARKISSDTEDILYSELDVLGVMPIYQGVIRVPWGMEWRTDY